jgi:3-oxoacyl-(acyl-carrier-protein) synthase
MHRVAITGLGVLAPNGCGTRAFADGLWSSRNGVTRIDAFDPGALRSQIAGQLPPGALPDDSPLFAADDDRVVKIALAAAHEAMVEAGLERLPDDIDPSRVGASISNAIGGTMRMTEHYPSITAGGTGPLDIASAHAALHLSATFNTPAVAVADAYGLTGPVVTLTTGCTGGNDALGFAFDAIRRGEVDVMLAGAAEAPITPFVVACFDVIGALSIRNDDPAHASRPFDESRDGFVLAEGAGLAVLERWEHAIGRGAPILGEVLGFGSCANAFHMTDLASHGTDLARSFRLALADARLPAERIGYVNAHGSSTPQNDRCETNAIKQALGGRAYETPVSSIKSMIGHALAAANALEFVGSAMALRDQVLPPTINHVAPGEACDLDYVPNEARDERFDVVASLSSGFGGIHSTVILGKAA